MNNSIVKKIAIVSIVFKPTQLECENIKSLSKISDYCYLYFNSDIDENYDNLLKLKVNDNFENVGISKAMNKLAKKATCDGMTHIFFFDQDTIVNKKIFKTKIIDIIYKNNPDEVINFVSQNKKQKFLINSGLLLPLSVLNKINFIDESYATECVDYATQLRLMKNNIKWRFEHVPGFLDHEKLQPVAKTFNFLGKKVYIRAYKFRAAEIVKNHMRVAISGLINGKFIFSFGIFRGLLIFIAAQVLTNTYFAIKSLNWSKS